MKISLIYHPSVPKSDALTESLSALCGLLDKSAAEYVCVAQEIPFVVDEDTSMAFYVVPHDRRLVKQYLAASRELRIPYTFVKPDATTLIPKRIGCPVTFLEEEAEKGQFAAAFGRYCGTAIDLICANDFGSKAKTTIDKIAALLDKFQLHYERLEADKDSFKVYKEIAKKTQDGVWDMLLLSASRDYGLDDIIFGPPELHAILLSEVSVMLVNPRGDLYALCD